MDLITSICSVIPTLVLYSTATVKGELPICQFATQMSTRKPEIQWSKNPGNQPGSCGDQTSLMLTILLFSRVKLIYFSFFLSQSSYEKSTDNVLYVR